MPLPVLNSDEAIKLSEKVDRLRHRQFEIDHEPRPELSDEQKERERWQWESNKFASEHPLYAAARSAANFRPVLPLEPGSTRPLVPVSDATMDGRRVFQLWQEWPTANVGTIVGRPYLIAIHFRDAKARLELRQFHNVSLLEDDPDAKQYERMTSEIREFPAWDFAKLFFVGQGQRFRTVTGWGNDASAKLKQLEGYGGKIPPDQWFCWSYPPVQSGLDAFEYPHRRIASGVDLLGPGSVVPWVGSRFGNGMILQGPSSYLPEMPAWLGARIGKPRSRKVMDAARQAYEQGIAEMGMVDTRSIEEAYKVERARRALPAPAK
jgi:hypothetical protein